MVRRVGVNKQTPYEVQTAIEAGCQEIGLNGVGQGRIDATSSLAETGQGDKKATVQSFVTLELQPIVSIRCVTKDSRSGSSEDLQSEYFSHFSLRNEGQGPAVELEAAILDGHRRLLEAHRTTILAIGEEFSFKPAVPLEQCHWTRTSTTPSVSIGKC